MAIFNSYVSLPEGSFDMVSNGFLEFDMVLDCFLRW